MKPEIGDIWQLGIDEKASQYLLLEDSNIHSHQNTKYFNAMKLEDGSLALIGINTDIKDSPFYYWVKVA